MTIGTKWGLYITTLTCTNTRTHRGVGKGVQELLWKF